MKQIKLLFGQWLEFHWKHFLRALHTYCLIVVPFILISLIGLIFSFLMGAELFNILEFGRDYFYDGKLLNLLIAWRIHLLWFIVCLLSASE